MLLSFALTRWAYQSPIKRASFYHAHHFSSECWATDRVLTDKTVSGALQSAGENQGLVIWYYQYEASGLQFATYLDDRLRVEEEQDYLTRIRTHPDGYTEAGYQERLRRFGALTLAYRMNGTPAPDEVPAG
jgi:hypothetical protein